MSAPESAQPAHLARESARVLPHMRAKSRYLAADAQGGFALHDTRRTSGRAVLQVAAEVVRAWVRAELLVRRPCSADEKSVGEQFILSPLGRAHVARLLSPEAGHAAQHRVLAPLPARVQGEVPRINLAESPLAWLGTRKDAQGVALLAPEEVMAGERLREDFTHAHMQPRSTVSWPQERIDRPVRTDYSLAYESDRAIAARRRYWVAVEALGADLAPAVVAVCCHLHGLEAVEGLLGLPRRAGKEVLRLGLRALAAHYGFLPRTSVRERLNALRLQDVPLR